MDLIEKGKPEYIPLPGESSWETRARVDAAIGRENAGRIASVITHPSSHSVRTHAHEFGGVDQMRQAVLGALNDPDTLIKKSSEKGRDGKVKDKYFLYNQKSGVYICIDPTATDWGTAHMVAPEDAKRKFNAISSSPAQTLGRSNYLSKMDLDYFQVHTRLHQNHQTHHNTGGGRFGRAAAAVGVAVAALSAAQEASAASTAQGAVIAAGREMLMSIIPFSGSAEALSQGRNAEAIVSFVGDCAWIGMGAAEVLRPVLRAAGANVEPGMVETALSSLRPSNEISPQKARMLEMVREIPALSPQEIESRRIPFGPISQVSAQKYQMAQEMEKIKSLVNGRNLEDLSPAEQEQYGRLMGRVQMSAREIKRVWEKEVDRKLGPSCNYGGSDPVQGLRNQITENLNRGSTRRKILSPDDITPKGIDLTGVFGTSRGLEPPEETNEDELQCAPPQNEPDPEAEPRTGRYDILKERGELSQIFGGVNNAPKPEPVPNNPPTGSSARIVLVETVVFKP